MRAVRKTLSHRGCCCYLVAQSHLTLCNSMDCSPPDSPVRGISQARILEWVAISFSKESSLTISCTARHTLPLSHLGSPLCGRAGHKQGGWKSSEPILPNSVSYTFFKKRYFPGRVMQSCIFKSWNKHFINLFIHQIPMHLLFPRQQELVSWLTCLAKQWFQEIYHHFSSTTTFKGHWKHRSDRIVKGPGSVN